MASKKAERCALVTLKKNLVNNITIVNITQRQKNIATEA